MNTEKVKKKQGRETSTCFTVCSVLFYSILGLTYRIKFLIKCNIMTSQGALRIFPLQVYTLINNEDTSGISKLIIYIMIRWI